ncbi:MAG: nucleotidyltransferase domain-containing protein [Methanomassiliicoccaceae archaeon]|jgi:predicted nucleotidyltransferase|nr:nucleotidyltransferase domain-containing protein [Methanomassiliicoccaceae archaeon]
MRPSSTVRKVHTIDELKLLVAPVAERYGIAKVYLFGSVARGDSRENSDYDFCVEMGKIDNLFELSEFFLDLKEAVENEIDLVSTGSVKSEFLNKIMKESVVLYEG